MSAGVAVIHCTRCGRRGKTAFRPMRDEGSGAVKGYVCEDRGPCQRRADKKARLV